MSVDDGTEQAAVRKRAPLSYRARLRRFLPLLVGLLVFASRPVRADQDACLAAHEQAQLLRMHGRYLEARAQLIACAQADCPGVVRADCKGWLQEVENSLPSVVFALVDEHGHDLLEARVSSEAGLLSERADGRAIAIDPGLHKLRIEAAGFLPQELELSLHEGEKRRLLRVVLQQAHEAASTTPPSASARPDETQDARRARRLMLSGYVLAGLGFATLVTGVTLGMIGNHKLDALHAQGCQPDCDDGDVHAGEKKYVQANIAFGVSAALLGAGLFSWLWGYRKQRETVPAARPALSLGLGKGSAALAWEARF
jgi:hypothetical protein